VGYTDAEAIMEEPQNTPDERHRRWKSEASFFDEHGAAVLPLDPLTIKRYSPPHRLRFNKEFRFHILGDLTGKTVLDVGCGDGTNAVTLAKLGAHVTGIDISPKSIATAQERARINGLSDRMRLICAPLEVVDLAPDSFDIVWGDAILHHLIPELDAVLERLTACAKPGGLIIFSEPVNFNRTLRRIRFMVPVHTEATRTSVRSRRRRFVRSKGACRICASHDSRCSPGWTVLFYPTTTTSAPRRSGAA
jgi:2-polyprenyl-3-methyl-5-hydroxy-6-metoxy-1,4-benzoquinol methylase